MSPYVAASDGQEAGQCQLDFVMERRSGERPRAVFLAPVFRDLGLSHASLQDFREVN
ncbi:hypothetical protein X759_34360 [Mesorhizobium sp. LSHC420B00]|uniref:hypothetical protein n=1 Tax=unclassified Mesorhizobium TaxID=325217 RepID=UPI0003CF37B4|nr:hypothetical protein [Mesorhizobium sp. LSHC420B00]ESX62791.1 hypothetical protein X759_34360 [Mesorhizobium sp. LSHC420B00]